MAAPGGYIDQEAARAHFNDNREIRLYGANAARFDGTTSYGQAYTQHPLEPRPQGRGQQWQGELIATGHAAAAHAADVCNRALVRINELSLVTKAMMSCTTPECDALQPTVALCSVAPTLLRDDVLTRCGMI